MTVIWIAIIAAGAFIALLTWLVSLDTRRLALYDSCSSKFYKKAQPLVDDPDTPTEVLETIDVMNRIIVSDDGALLILRTMFKKLPEVDDEFDGKYENVATFFSNRPELARAFMECSAAALLATTYRNRFIGWYVRMLMAIMRRHKNIAPMVAGDVRDAYLHNGAMPQAV